MKFLSKKIVVATFFILLPLFSFAQTPSGPSNPQPGGGTPTPSGPSNPQPSQGLSYELRNPLAFDSLQDFIVAVLNVFIVIATPIVVIFIILAGFKYVTAQGNATKVQEATRALTYAIIGGVLIIGAVAVAEIIRDLVSSFS